MTHQILSSGSRVHANARSTHFRMGSHLGMALILFSFILLIFSVPVQAAVSSIIVNSFDDTLIAADGNCTLREAIINANADADLTDGDCAAGSGIDTISLSAGTYLLSLEEEGEDDDEESSEYYGDLDIWDALIIEGEGAENTIIDATAVNDRVFDIEADSTLSGITIRGGNSFSSGDGGGIYISYATVTVIDSIITENETAVQGGGIANNGGTLILIDSTVSHNQAKIGGGGIFNSGDGYAEIVGSTISNNEAGEGLFKNNRFGGGIKNVGAESYIQVTNSTISGNSTADDGGGIYNNSASINLLNVTLTDNHALSESGGIDNYGYINIENSIVAGNTAVTSNPDCRSLFGWPLISDGYNLFGTGTGCPAGGTDLTISPADVFTLAIEPLAQNGGATQTHGLLYGSPAVDAANNATCPSVDQRGISRPQFDGCDIGAFEADDFVQTGPTFTVNNSGDHDDELCSVADCSLREAISASNTNDGDDTINFDIADGYVTFIYPLSALPTITDPVTINGYGDNYVILDGGDSENSFDGLTITAGYSIVRGIGIQNFDGHAIVLSDQGYNLIEANDIIDNSGDGVRVLDAAGNSIFSNTLVGNGRLGIDLGGDGVTTNDANDPDSGANDLTNFPVIIRAVPDDGGIVVEGILNGIPNTTYALEFFGNESCNTSGYGEGETLFGTESVITDDDGNVEFNFFLYEDDVPTPNLITATATDSNGSTSEFSQCATVSIGNDSWPRALELTLIPDSVSPEVATATVTQFIDQQDQSRWYKFQVAPDSQLTVTLTDLPENYDLTVYKDIAATLATLINVDSTADLTQLSAEFAPDAFSPDAFSPDAFSPDAFSPDAFSPDAFSPDAFSPDVFSPDAFSPDAFSPDAFSPDAFSPDAFSPDAFSPDAFSPDAFSPDAFSPDAFSPDAFSSAQMSSLLAVSAYNGTASEGVKLNTWENDGTFYVRVRGRNGAFNLTDSFQLDVTLTSGSCSNVSSTLPAMSYLPTAGGYNTIILADFARMDQSSADFATMQAQLTALAARPEVNGIIVDLGSDAAIAAANVQADNFPACPFAKNVVAYAVKDIVDELRALNPIEYVVIVGSDEVVPFFRHPDEALLANERNYVPPVRDNTASQASLRLGYILSQDRYGSSMELSSRGGTLPIPDVAVGRLVETPSDILVHLNAYLATSDGIITPDSAFVSGYDFLEDAAIAVAAELEAGIGSPVDTLIVARDLSPTDPSAWTADDLRAQLLDKSHDITFLAGHFSASSTLAADYTTRVMASELLSSPIDMSNQIVFSAGCHAGYNIVDEHGIPGVTPEPDWSQAFAQKGAILIAGTGYQYGDTDFIEYSERLYLGFSQQLRAGSGPVSIGQAMVAAKQTYLAETAELRPLHEKALLVSTIFGLPMLRVNMPAERITPADDDSIVGATTQFSGNPGNMLGLEFADVTINAALTSNVVSLDIIGEDNMAVDATYLSGSSGVVVNTAEPMLPLEMRNVSVPGQVLRGVGFRGGTFTDVADILPLTGAATTEIRGVHAPFLSSTFYPVLPWQVNYYDALMGGDTRLATFPAQYKSNGVLSTDGTMRQYSDMDYRLYYSNYTAQSAISGNAPALAAPPSVSTISASVDDGVMTFSVRVVGDPSAGIQEVWVTYTGDGSAAGQWQSLDLTQDANDSTLWEGDLTLGDVTDVNYIVQAANGVGLVTAVTNLGSYYRVTADGVPIIPDPEVTEISLLSPPSSGAYSTVIEVSAVLTSDGAPLVEQPVVFSLGPQQRVALTDSNGEASAELALLGLPGTDTLQASFPGEDAYQPSQTSAPFTIEKQGTILTLEPQTAVSEPNADSGIVATLMDVTERPFNEKTIFFIIEGENGSYAAASISDFSGRASLGIVPLPVGTYSVTATFGNVVTLLDESTLDLTDDRYLGSTASSTLIIEEEADSIIYLSSSTHSWVDGFYFRNEDILAYNINEDSWEKWFDGADVGLFTANLFGLAILDDDSILMSFSQTRYLADIGWVDGNDIVRFIPTSLGEDTAGSFELYLDGSTVGLDSYDERVDAIGFGVDGRLLVSTTGSFSVDGLSGNREDLIALDADSSTWSLYFDGSDTGLGNQNGENIWGVSVDANSGELYLTTERSFFINRSFWGKGSDIISCSPDSLGAETSCELEFFWRGNEHGIGRLTIDALWIE